MKKILLSFLLFLTIFFSFTPYFSTVKAATNATWYNQSFKDWFGKVNDPTNPGDIFGERYTAAQVQWIIYGLFGFLVNTVTGPQNAGLIQCFISNSADITTCTTELSDLLKTTSVQKPSLAAANPQPKQNLWRLVFASNRPISGISYVHHVLQKLNPVSEVKAQSPGTGFKALEPIQSFWKACRDVAFGLFVIVAIVFAFMIMFRVKLSPQTVVSVQSALPKIVLSLILVTFSYAIAGFLIDIMYIFIGLVSVFGSRLMAFSLAPSAWFNFLTLGQPVGWNVQGGVLLLLAIYIMLFLLSLIVLLFVNIGAIASIIATAATALAFFATGGLLGWLAIILVVVAIIVVLWISIKIVWSLLKAFVNILLLTIFAPLQLALGAIIPNLGFGSWLKSYLANLGVFVMTGALFMLCYVFLAQGLVIGFTEYSSVGTEIVSLILGAPTTRLLEGGGVNNAAWPPLLGMGGGPGVGLLLVVASFVMFTLIPKANEMIQSFLSGKPFAYGTAIGEAVGPVTTIGRAGLAARVAKVEEGRKISMAAGYEPSQLTQILRTLGITKS